MEGLGHPLACGHALAGFLPPFVHDSVRQMLGHDDYRCIEAYIAIVRREKPAMREGYPPPPSALLTGFVRALFKSLRLHVGAEEVAHPFGRKVEVVVKPRPGHIALVVPHVFCL